MKKILVIGILIFWTLNVYGQEVHLDTLKTDIMKQPMLGLRTVCYFVDDMDNAKDWYSKAFETKPYFDESYYMGFNIGGYELGIQPRGDQQKPGGDNILAYWGVEDIDREFERLVELGAKIHEEPTNVGGELMVASIIDPWGNIIGIIYNPYFKLPGNED